MALQEPVAVYSAKTNTEAMMLCYTLKQEGIEANLMEDLSSIGLGEGGTPPNIHLLKVWVDKSDESRAAEILQNYEKSVFDHLPERTAGVADETLVQAVCEGCGKASMFSGKILGSVQECPFCGDFMDVESAEGQADWDGEWETDESDDDAADKE
jgi:Putative prokaryotic signal transducing protein